VIYRDIKPQNLIIDEERNVRFIDFGITRLYNPVKEQDTIFMGTPGFAPPEQFRQRQTDPRSDLYSLGATMHYLLTLRDPGCSPFDFAPVSLSNPSVSPLMDKVIQKALEIKAENRFQNARDMRKVLMGQLAFDELFRQSFIIIEPREVLFHGLSPGAVHVREVTIKSSAGDPVKGTITTAHPGLKVEPARIDAPSVVVRVSPGDRQFPRGEKVLTSMTLSTECQKITIPVTVEFKPTFIRGLSPAMLGIIFLLIPLIPFIAWVCLLLEPAGTSSPGNFLLILFSALMTGAFIPSAFLRKLTLLFYAGLAFFLLFMRLLLFSSLARPEIALYPNILTSALWFLFISISVNTVLFIFAFSLSPAQKSASGMVILADFFLFPVLLYVVSCFKIISHSFIFDHRYIFFSLTGLVSLFYAIVWLCITRMEKSEGSAGSRPGAHRIMSIAGTIAITALFAAIWYYIGVNAYSPSAYRESFYHELPLTLLRHTVFLPGELSGRSLSLFGHLFPWSIILVGTAAILISLLHIFSPATKLPIKMMLSLIFLGVYSSLGMSLLDVWGKSALQFEKAYTRSPMVFLKDIRAFDRQGLYSTRLMQFLGRLENGYEDCARRSFVPAEYEYRAALSCHPEVMKRGYFMENRVTSLTLKKILFLQDQAGIWRSTEGNQGRAWEFSYFNAELTGSSARFSSQALEYFHGEYNLDGDWDIEKAFIVPDIHFFFVTESGCMIYEDDYEVLSSIRFCQGISRERTGNFSGAKECFGEMEKLLQAQGCRASKIREKLTKESEMRKKLYEKYPDVRGYGGEYCEELASEYEKEGNYYFAIPLWVHRLDNYPATEDQRTCIIEACENGRDHITKYMYK
jgi:hypothetical protein